MTRKVRTTNQPDKEIEVDDQEYLDLERQGLLVDTKSGKKSSGSGSGSGSGGTSNNTTSGS